MHPPQDVMQGRLLDVIVSVPMKRPYLESTQADRGKAVMTGVFQVTDAEAGHILMETAAQEYLFTVACLLYSGRRALPPSTC